MTQSLITLVIAMTFFVSSHFVMASLPVRAFVIGRIGETGHRALFSGVSIASLIWMLLSFGDARYDTIPLWDHSPALSMIPVLLLPITCILVVCSLTSRLPTAVGGENVKGRDGSYPKSDKNPDTGPGSTWAGVKPRRAPSST